MRVRRSPANPNTADADAYSADLSEYPDLPEPDVDLDSPRSTPKAQGPLALCLSCGESPGARTECLHPEVVHLDAPPTALRVAAQRLAHASQERRALERSLRKLVSQELSAGSAELSLSPPEVVTAPPAICPRCAQGEALATRVSSASQQGASRHTRPRVSEHQRLFGFATPPPVLPPELPPELPPGAPCAAPAVPADEGPVAPTQANRSGRGRRKKKSPELAQHAELAAPADLQSPLVASR